MNPVVKSINIVYDFHVFYCAIIYVDNARIWVVLFVFMLISLVLATLIFSLAKPAWVLAFEWLRE